jgi:hypothetical protein
MINCIIINKVIVRILKITNKDKKIGMTQKIKISSNIMIMGHKTNHNNQHNLKVKIN